MALDSGQLRLLHGIDSCVCFRTRNGIRVQFAASSLSWETLRAFDLGLIYHWTGAGEPSPASEPSLAVCHQRHSGRRYLHGANLRTRISTIITYLLPTLVFTMVNPARHLA
jgi:hypothetical protein